MVSTAPGTATRQGTASSRPLTHAASFSVPDRASSLKTNSYLHISTSSGNAHSTETLIFAYLVTGLNRDPHVWRRVAPGQPKAHLQSKGSIGPGYLPEVLGSTPKITVDERTSQIFSEAARASFPNDIEICSQETPPSYTCHSFVLQRCPTKTFYGVALRIWVKADADRVAAVREGLDDRNHERFGKNTPLWIPYSLTYLSLYPVFSLMNDFLRSSWIKWHQSPDKFHSNGVLRFLRVPAPVPNELLRVEMGSYTLCYHIPSSPTEFQNFNLWPLFATLSPRNIVAILETAISTKGRLVFISKHYDVLTLAAEAVRFYVRSWAGLYVPVAYGRQIQELIEEPAPYIIGVTKQSRSLFTTPRDVMLVDLDFDRIFTAEPPTLLSTHQRSKCAAVLERSIGGVRPSLGVPEHLRLAYSSNMNFVAIGSAIIFEQSLEKVEDPAWWNHDEVLTAITYVCSRIRRNIKFMAMASGRLKPKSSVKISNLKLAELIHERNQLSRGASDAWREFISLKTRMDTQVSRLVDQKEVVNSELEKSKKDFSELSLCANQLIETTNRLRAMTGKERQKNSLLSSQLAQQTEREQHVQAQFSELRNQYDAAIKALDLQQEIIEEIDNRREYECKALTEFKERHKKVWQERDDAQRAVAHLSSLISGQISYIDRLMSSMTVIKARSPPGRHNASGSISFGRQSPSLLQHQPPPRSSGSPEVDVWSVALKRQSVDLTRKPSPVLNSDRRHSVRLSQPVYSDGDENVQVDKVAMIAEAIRKISHYCVTAVEDLAVQMTEVRETPEASEGSTGSVSSQEGQFEEEAVAEGKKTPITVLPRLGRDSGWSLRATPELDSRAPTPASDIVEESRHVNLNDPKTTAAEPRVLNHDEDSAAPDHTTKREPGQDRSGEERSSSQAPYLSSPNGSLIENQWEVRLASPDPE